MFRSYIKLAYKNLKKNWFFNFSNILILAMVLAAVLHLFSYVSFEKSYDQFHTNIDKLVRARVNIEREGNTVSYAMSIGLLGDLIKQESPEVDQYARISPLPDDGTFVYGTRSFRETNTYYVDTSFFKVFSFPLLVGDPDKVLETPNAIVLTSEMAHKYFNNDNPIGKIIKIKGKYSTFDATVTGIMKEIPGNSHIHFNCVISNKSLLQATEEFRKGTMMAFWTYLLMKSSHTDLAKLENKINKALNTRQPLENQRVTVSLQPMKDIHLYSSYETEIEKGQNGNHRIIYLLLSIGLVCLVIAYLNFINMSVVRAMERSFEVGMRNILGATLKDNIRLFFVEAVVQTTLSFIVGVIIYFLTLPLVNYFFHYGAVFYIWNDLGFLGIFFLSFVGINVIFSLLYAYVYSRMEPTAILRSDKTLVTRNVSARNIPVILQFVSCVFFISFMLVVIRQGMFIQNKDLGFDRKNIVMIMQPHLDSFWHVYSKMPAFEEEIKHIAAVKEVTQAVYNPGYNNYGQFSNVSSTKENKRGALFLAVNGVRYNFFTLYGMKLLAGKLFDRESGGDVVVVNESAARILGYAKPIEAVGEGVYFYKSKGVARILGVIKDHHQRTLQHKIQPLIFYIDNDVRHAIVVKLEDGKADNALAAIHEAWNRTFPENDFSYEMLDQKINQLYENEQIFKKWLLLFSFLSICICAIGIITIMFYTYRQKEREVSIRKVFGANTFDIISLSKGFFVLIVISTLLGLIISYFISERWLQSYEYHTLIGLWFVIIPFAIVMLFSIISLVYAVIRSASVDPVQSLRNE